MMSNSEDVNGDQLPLPNIKKRRTSERTILDYLPSSKNGEQKSAIKTDWRVECEDSVSRKEDLFTDIKFVICKGDQRKEFHAHKAVLASVSPVFQCMFYGSEVPRRTVIEIDEDPEAFGMLLNYIYGKGSEITFKSLIAAQKFFITGSKYLVYKIEQKAKECIEEIYHSDDDFWDAMQEMSFNFSCPLLSNTFNSYIMEKTKDFFSSHKWLSAPETLVENILQMSELNISELNLLKEVTKWTYHNKKPVTTDNLIKYFKHIRFSTLSTYDLMDFIQKYPKALEAETYLEILWHLYSMSDRNLPQWCTMSEVSRKKQYEIRYPGSYDEGDGIWD